MTRYITLSITFSLLLILSSCHASRKLAAPVVSDQTVQDYVNTYKALAVSEMTRTGIPASITLAQGIIESDCGHSSLAREANNHFGIKCHNDWTGATVRHDDNSRNECFRKYKRPEDSFYDHSDFLKTGQRYSFLFALGSTDYKSWAHGLRKAGYATNPDYANMLIRTIEQNNLWQFDKGMPVVYPQITEKTASPKDNAPLISSDSTRKPVQNQSSSGVVMAKVPRIMENNRVQYIIVKDGETRERIEDEFQLLKWELARYNEMKGDFTVKPGQILYLQPKREKADAGKDFYTTVEGDTMYQVSQKFGVKLKKLFEMNRMAEGDSVQVGTRIWLRTVKPVN